MGLDLVGWRACELQAQLGQAGFLGKLKLRVYRNFLEHTFRERKTPEAERGHFKLEIDVPGRGCRTTTYAEICDELGEFQAGIPACKDCPLALGEPVGCYRFVTYPIQADAEERLFAFFAEDVARDSSFSRALLEELVVDIAAEAAEAWAKDCAERSEPLSVTISDEVVTSRQLLAAIIAVDHQDGGTLPLVSAWLTDFSADLLLGNLTPSVGDDGTVKLVVDGAPFFEASGSLKEILRVQQLFAAVAENDGWEVCWDG